MALLSVLACGDQLLAQSQPASAPASQPATLRASIGALPYYDPLQPIPIRLLLTNTGNTPVSVPVATDELGQPRVELAPSAVYGTYSGPALSLRYQGEPPTPVARPSQSAGDALPQTLRLAPGAVIGAELDLATVCRTARYAGEYELSWNPGLPDTAGAVARFRVEPRRTATFVTDFGKLSFQLRYDAAPLNVANFVELSRQRFYDGTRFHRIIPGALIQGGDPRGDGRGTRADNKTVPAEFDNTPMEVGTLAMSRLPDDPGSASSQFFICLDRMPELDGRYTVIGQARDEESLRTLRRLADQPVNADGVPQRPVVLRNVTLIDAEQRRTTRQDYSSSQPASR